MASSRESSPASDSRASPAPLTPNSKVKAMLAAFDNDSEDDIASGSARTRVLASITRKNPANEGKPDEKAHSSEAAMENVTTQDVSGEDEEDEDIIRPKGRMAARMHGSIDSREPVVSPPNDARARVRKMFMKKRSKSPSPNPNIENEAEIYREDASIASPKQNVRVLSQATPESSPAKDTPSPGLFVSPEARKTIGPASNGSDSDEDNEDRFSNNRFLALVAKKKAELLAKEADLAKDLAKKEAERKRHAALLEEEDEIEESDEDIERRLTQQSRPSRKANKKALEEMHRETQRLKRNQQLTHNAITKKKITKASLFAKFNYKPAGYVEDNAAEPPRPRSSSSAAPQSDVEARDTPPTSPVSFPGDCEKFDVGPTLPRSPLLVEEQMVDDVPPFDVSHQISSSPPTRLDKGKGKVIEGLDPEPKVSRKPLFVQRPIRVRPPKVADRVISAIDDSDSDLEIVTTKTPVSKKKLDAIFDRLPAKQAKEPHSIQALRMLAHLTSPGKQSFGRNKKPSISSTELQISLQQRARQQAALQKEEKLQSLKDRGIILQTPEEREKEMAEVDDLLAKARREEQELVKRERDAAKKERQENGDIGALGDSTDDEDWEEESDAGNEELSGSASDDNDVENPDEEDTIASSEEDGEDDEDDAALDGQGPDGVLLNAMFDNEADETEHDEVEAEADLSVEEQMAEDGDVDDEDEEELPLKPQRARKTNVVLDEEEEEEDVKQTPLPPQLESPIQRTDSPVAPNSVLRSATKTFIPGLTVAGPAGLGLTQIFAGTMDESQLDPFEAPSTALNSEIPREQDSLAFLRGLPVPELPPFVPTIADDTQDVDMASASQFSHVPESQPMDSIVQNIQINFSQSQVHGFDSLVQGTQFSPFPEATQDAGFQHMTPVKGRFVQGPPSTVDTLVLEQTALADTVVETPVVRKKGKLRRRVHVASFSDEEDTPEEGEIDAEEDEFDITANAFDVMRKASKKKIVVDEFDKKKSKAKGMVHDQAEESEDEYAGLGGASDDESGEEDEYVKEIIDDEGGKDVDERQLAAFYADRERASDEKQVEKLYKDITNGMLRRNRGADFDLSDSDDGGEARQRMKRKEFARMRKALLADERLGKIAENPKRQAFLRAIEDRGSGDEMDFLDDFIDQEEGTDSQSQSQSEGVQQVVPDSQPTEAPHPKRKRGDDVEDNASRLPPSLRRAKAAKKPSNLSEIRESLSSLIEEPNAVVAPADSGSDSEDELLVEGGDDLGSQKEKNKENRDPFALRRKNIAIVDRISLKRASSTSLSNSSRLAFAVSNNAPGFKVPPLLRRATTNNSLASNSSSSSVGMSTTERMAGGAGSDGIKRGGGKNSGVNYFARENERRAAVAKTEKRREQKLVKGAQVRRKAVGGLFGGGKFE